VLDASDASGVIGWLLHWLVIVLFRMPRMLHLLVIALALSLDGFGCLGCFNVLVTALVIAMFRMPRMQCKSVAFCFVSTHQAGVKNKWRIFYLE